MIYGFTLNEIETKRLATRNRSRISIHVIFYGSGLRMVNPIELKRISCHLVSASRTICLLCVIRYRRRQGVPKFWARNAIGTVVRLTPRNTPSHVLSCRIWSPTSNAIRSAGKWALLVPPFNITQGYRNRYGSLGYDFRLVIYSKREPSHTISEINGVFGCKSQIAFTSYI